jgi:hypothetical protein
MREDGRWTMDDRGQTIDEVSLKRRLDSCLRRNDNIKNPKPGVLTNGEKFIYFAVLAQDVLTIIKVNPVKN